MITRYETTQPTAQFTLAHHSLEDWATATYHRLMALGCSDAYAVSVYRRIKRAKEV
jgi:hypothetical protein